MRVRGAVIGMFAVASLAGCNGYGGGAGYRGGGGGGPVGSVTAGPGIQFVSGHSSMGAPYLFMMSPLVTGPNTLKPSEGIKTLKKTPLPAATPSSQK